MSTTAESVPPVRRAHRGEIVSVAGALMLPGLMFLLKWYGVDGIPGRSALTRAENAWQALPVLRWLMLLTALATVCAPVLHLAGQSRAGDVRRILAILAPVTWILVAYRVLVSLPSPSSVVDQKLGAYLGLLSATAIAVGAFDAARALDLPRERRRRRRGRIRPGRRTAAQ